MKTHTPHMASSPIIQLLSVLLGTWVGWRLLKRAFARDPFAHIPGPGSSSWLGGNLLDVFDKTKGWDFNFNIAKTYGRVSRITMFFSAPGLYVYDPKALHHIIVKDQHIFEEPEDFIRTNGKMFGLGLLSTLGDHHKKQRKLLNPVFSTTHMKEMTPTFYSVTQKLQRSITKQIESGETEIDMLQWMTRTALELIGQSGFGYSFDTLEPDGVQHQFGISVKNLFRGVNNTGILLTRFILWPHIFNVGSSGFQRWVVDTLPWKALHEVRDMVDIMHNTSVDIFESTKRALAKGEDPSARIGGGKDIMSILVKANMNASQEDKLPDSELLAQISTLTFAAMDTTSNALARILDLLSQHPDVQDKVREEVSNAFEEHGSELDFDTVMALPWLDSICRETLRLYPSVPTLSRHAREDVMLPLSEPILSKSGKEINEILIPAGTDIIFSILSCNRDPKIWGPDADEWKPERWMNPLPNTVSEAKVPGVYSHLMTFIGGGRACIGFKFSQLEMKVVLSLLLQKFKFSPTGQKVVWEMNAIVQPTTEDAEVLSTGERKLQLPLKVSLVSSK
ncbi:cytochrome P450 [Ephemerocybe angulata]|uniref:Cytochrome P450 n=1 Tax=Ephemerocybe angulata TaxID=980116 RepID=A0A8H6M4M0_9AGAR|nr:cytochrome P450 [Tulosesus angulatus]